MFNRGKLAEIGRGFIKAEKPQPKQTSIITKIVDTIIPKANADILEALSLEDCYITQSEEEHIKKGKGSMYAIDISCGKKFKVYSPNNYEKYLVEQIGVDERLGNYVVLKNEDTRFVFGHTISTLNVGDRIEKNTIIGETNISGMSTGNHLHLELWKRNNNISFKYLENGEILTSEKSFDIRIQRKWVEEKEINDKILDFIAGFEGCHLKSYYDINHYSIGYGTKSFEGEEITQEEADKRARKHIQGIRERYGLNTYSIGIQIAITSFVYNRGSLTDKQIWLLENGYFTALKNDIKEYNKAGGKILNGLVKRRIAEINLF